jgi:hypothetical protein
VRFIVVAIFNGLLEFLKRLLSTFTGHGGKLNLISRERALNLTQRQFLGHVRAKSQPIHREDKNWTMLNAANCIIKDSNVNGGPNNR